MSTALSEKKISAPAFQPGAEYPVYGKARNGGAYNSHLVSGVVFTALGCAGAINIWLVVWLNACIVAGLLLDTRTLRRKVALAAIPGQMLCYMQVLLRAMLHAFPYYVFAFCIYICVAPVLPALSLAVSSFVMLYGFYMVVRLFWLLRYLWVLLFRWDNAGRTFATHQANLKSRPVAIRHVLWAYFLGNVGLVVRCSSQVITIAGFEFLRRSFSLDLAAHPVTGPYVTTVFIVAAVIWFATFWWAVQPALLVYYRMHRTFHTCRPLYDSIHSIHHRGVLPTQLDSGTISPLEFFITEMMLPAATLAPDWYWTAGQVLLAFVGHLPSHDTNTWMKTGHHHLLHHRLFNVNFGLLPREDERYGTRYTEPENS